MKNNRYSLFQIAFLSMMGALVYVLKTYFDFSLQLPGHNGIFWVTPIIIGAGVAKKLGSATYASLIAGILLGLTGSEVVGPFALFEFLTMGLTIDLLAASFKGYSNNVVVGFLVGSVGNMSKMAAHYLVFLILGMTSMHLVLVGIGIATISYFIFGGIGGTIASIILKRCEHALTGAAKQPAKEATIKENWKSVLQ